MNFGKWIFVAFVFFALFIGTLVTVCVRQDIPLVTKDYYKEELVYQEQIVRMENASHLADQPELFVYANQLRIRYTLLPEIKAGSIRLVRPSDDKLDQQFTLQPSSGTEQAFDIANPVPGLYRAHFTWQQEGREYYIEKVVVL